MFMRVNSKCAHQVRPPLSQNGGGLSCWQTLGDKNEAAGAAADGRLRLLERMRENGAIDQVAFERAARSEIVLTDPPPSHAACKA